MNIFEGFFVRLAVCFFSQLLLTSLHVTALTAEVLPLLSLCSLAPNFESL